MKYLFIHIFTFVMISFTGKNIFAQNYSNQRTDSLLIETNEDIISYSMTDSVMNKFPFKNQNNVNRFFPGVVSYFQKFYIRGGESYETGFFIDGVKFNDLFTGDNSFFINPDVFEKIDYYNGFIPNEFGNTSSGLFDYKIKTGGEKLEFNVEHQTDNLTFTNDAFSGRKRLGAYFYGYNETNLNLGGPLYFDNVRFFANVNYLFQRDKNPQRYPGIDNVTFADQIYEDSITINLPAGIVPYNSFESFNLVSTLLLDFNKIKIKVFGIYFNENEFTDREHILQYLNPRLGLIDKSGGIVNLNFDHKINDIFSYSLGANYFQKSEITTDQYLGENYWSYGDSVANAEAGVVWNKETWNSGRYRPPSNRRVMLWSFQASGFPTIDFQKSNQEKVSFSGNFKINFKKHLIKIGGEFNQHQLKFWQLINQYNLARYYASLRENPDFQDFSNEELKELIAINSGVNNFGYDPIGKNINAGLDKPIEPVFLSAYVGDQFNILENLYFYLGLRYDNFDFDYKKMIDPAAPENTFDVFTNKVIEEGLIDTKNFVSFSPKAYIKFSPLNNLSFAANYSQNVQTYPFSEIYRGIHSIAYFSQLYGGGIGDAGFRTGDLKPIITKEFEFSLFYTPFTNFNTCLTYYNKKTKNYFSLEYQGTNPASSFFPYYYYGFNGEMKTEGIELLFDYNYNGLSIRSIINYQNPEETKFSTPTNPFANLVHVIVNYVEPERSNRFYFNLFLNYNFEQLKESSIIFNDLEMSAIFNFNNGHPFKLESVPFYYPVQPVPERTPSVFQTDLKIEKRFKLFSQLNFGIYLYVINLFDTKNVFNVFSTSGSAEDNGFDLKNYELMYGEQVTELHKLDNLYNPWGDQQTYYGPPRQIGFGIKLNY